ncbi:MAG: hypothetical protein VB108_00495 [Anaerolineaceae bacterium]|nr:hypothetical protein [Anaerolineaceae bacterium]
MQKLFSWLLEEENPSLRYLAMRNLKALGTSPAQLAIAKKRAHREGKIPQILDKMESEGYWVKPGAGYTPKYLSGVWSLLLLAQLGASVEEDPRIKTAMEYYTEQAFTQFGKISWNGSPYGSFDCLQGNMVYALLSLGMPSARLAEQIDWLARSQTGEGIASSADKKASVRYGSGKCGPAFACTYNYGNPCAWGAIRAVMGLTRLPESERTAMAKEAIAMAVNFLLQASPEHPVWPGDKTMSSHWHKFTFPLFYMSDLLHIAEALAAAGALSHEKASPLLTYILSKRNPDGSWNLEYSSQSVGGSFGRSGKPNKWVTLRVLRVLEAANLSDEQ